MNFADVEANPEFKVIALWPPLVAFCKLLLEINRAINRCDRTCECCYDTVVCAAKDMPAMIADHPMHDFACFRFAGRSHGLPAASCLPPSCRGTRSLVIPGCCQCPLITRGNSVGS